MLEFEPGHSASLTLKKILVVLAGSIFCSIPAIVLISLDRNPFSFRRLLSETPSTLSWYLVALGLMLIYRRVRKWRERRYVEEIEERMRSAGSSPDGS
jgi:hypothetical protein